MCPLVAYLCGDMVNQYELLMRPAPVHTYSGSKAAFNGLRTTLKWCLLRQLVLCGKSDNSTRREDEATGRSVDNGFGTGCLYCGHIDTMLTCIMCICIPCQSGAVLLHVIMCACMRACMHVADCIYRGG